MKKLLAFITLFLVLGGVANAEYSSWDCKKINNDKYKCLSKISSEKYNATAEYVGQIKNLKPGGEGIYKIINDDVYGEGIFTTQPNNKIQLIEGLQKVGETTFYSKNSKVYKILNPLGVFEGEWDRKDALKGTFTHLNGDVFKGTMKGVDLFTPIQGTYFWASGLKYVGDFKKGKPDGQGIYYWANGEKYVGEFKDGNYTGQGTLTFPNGEKYVGEFNNGKYSGQGTLTFPNGEKYVGKFKDGDYYGQGTLTHANGDKYVGEFKKGKYLGRGTYTYANGETATGQWYEGKLLHPASKINTKKTNSSAKIGTFEIVFLVIMIPLVTVFVLKFIYWPFVRDWVYLPYKQNPSAFISKAAMALFILAIIAVSLGGGGDTGCNPRFFQEGPRC